VIYGKTQDQKNREWAEHRRAHFAKGKPTRVFAWRPVRREEDGLTVWLEYVWRILYIHENGRVWKTEYSSTRETAQKGYDIWQSCRTR
jgi:hypothetical protein